MSEQITLVPTNSLITSTTEEGRMLAKRMSRLIIKVTQPDVAVHEKLRPIYAEYAACSLPLVRLWRLNLLPLLRRIIIEEIFKNFF